MKKKKSTQEMVVKMKKNLNWIEKYYFEIYIYVYIHFLMWLSIIYSFIMRV